LSEMADTITSNVATLKECMRNIDEAKVIREVERIHESVKMFRTRSDLPVTNSDVHNLLKYAIADNDEESDTTFDQMEHLGMLLYVIGCHQKQLRSLVHNPHESQREGPPKAQEPSSKEIARTATTKYKI